MTNQPNTAAVHRAERIESAQDLVTHLFQLEKDRLQTRAALAQIGCALVNVHGMSVVDAAGICGMTRQRLAQELRILELTGDSEAQK